LIEGPACGAPPPRRFRPRTGSANLPLTPHVVEPLRGRKPRGVTRPEPLLPPPRQRPRLPRSRAPFLDECSLGAAFTEPRTRARHPSLDFAIQAGLPTLFRLPEFRRARHRRFRRLFASERSAPRAARRLLQFRRFASTTDGPTELQAREGSARLSPWISFLPGPAILLAKVRDRGVMGQRPALVGDATPAPSDAIARIRRLGPNPIGSDTSCRATAAFVAGVATTHLRPRLRAPLSRAAARLPLSRDPGRAASRALPRRRARSAAPEVPSVPEPPLEGRGLCPHTVPSLWTTGLAPLQSSLVPAP
jgi:hypothetical protein